MPKYIIIHVSYLNIHIINCGKILFEAIITLIRQYDQWLRNLASGSVRWVITENRLEKKLKLK